MADNNDLRVKIGADTTDLQQGLSKAGKEVKQFGNETKKATDTQGKFAKKTAGNAVPAVQEFSRVIQDAPYGIQGVANNIQQLTAQFGYLSKSSGGAGSAIKSMVGSLLGPAGVLLAVSAITSLWVAYEDEIKQAIGTTDLLGDAFKDASEGIGENIGKLDKLVNAYNNASTSIEDKTKILGVLQKNYPEYFSNIDSETIKIDKATGAYKEQRNAIIALGIEKSLESKKAPIYAKLAELEIKSNSDLLTSLDKVFIYSGQLSSSQRVQAIKELGEKARTQQQIELNKELGVIDKGIKAIQDRFNISGTAGLNLEGSGVDSGKKPTKKKVSELTGLPEPDEFFKYSQLAKEGFQNILNIYGGASEVLSTTIQPLPPLIDKDALTADELAYNNHLENVKQALINFNDTASQIISDVIYDTFAQIGAGIGQALAEGGNVLEAVGSSLLSGLGTILVELGKLAIATGVGILAIKLGLESLNPVIAIAAGVALVALGTFVGAKASSIGGNIGSGSSGSSTRGVAGGGSSSFSGSTASTSNASSGGGTYVFEIEGTKLVGVLSNTLNRNRALGGSLSLT